MTLVITSLRKFFNLFKRKFKLDVPTIYMSKEERDKTILNAVNILERNIKLLNNE